MAPNMGFVVGGYLLTAVALGGYALLLFARARAARADALRAAERRGRRA